MADEHITVTPGPKAKPSRVILYERDDAHPEGEVFITAPAEGETPEAVKVGRTPAVELRLQRGELVEGGVRAARAAEREAETAEAEQAPERRGRG